MSRIFLGFLISVGLGDFEHTGFLLFFGGIRSSLDNLLLVLSNGGNLLGLPAFSTSSAFGFSFVDVLLLLIANRRIVSGFDHEWGRAFAFAFLFLLLLLLSLIERNAV